MTEKEKELFYKEINFLVKLIIRNKRTICLRQKDFANIFNRCGMIFYSLKNMPTAKACFWIAMELGNSIAFRNYLSIN